VPELLRALRGEGEIGAIVVADEALGSEDARAFVEALDEQPTWSDLPVIMLTRNARPGSAVAPLLGRRGVEALRRPLDPETMRAAVRSALEIRSRQYLVRDLLAESRQLSRRLEHRASQLRRLTFQLSDTEERERRQLAEYLHDDLQQILAGAVFHLDLTERKLQDPGSARSALQKVRELLADAIQGTRTVSQELSPTALRRGGLVSGLRWLAEHVRELHGLRVKVTSSLRSEPEDQSLATFLFRAAQELLLNVSKHAGTNEAEVVLSTEGDLYHLLVRDQGVGFAADDEEGESETSFGLFSIRERAEILGGTVQIDSEVGVGTSISIVLPNSRKADGAPGAPLEVQDARATVRATPEATPVRVVLVDDHRVLRSGLKLLLVEHPEIDVVGELDDGEQAVEAAARLHPDIMVMDVAMPRLDGVEATRAIKEIHPEIRIIGLSMFQDEDTADRMLNAGAELYLPKTGPSERLVAAILGR